ncbi:AEC family transporter [Marinomonas sp. M1K-6]|uniref:AEC family transporter n=1 Tax=Marinomonas profundi TaxID=2726122 RepID=A0A847QVZ3_9GAMM|nr:AEC family transporter [Marinomonas profundi]NLQ17358.1 AEC family transporter [Marinomonas profundi]UDV01886.1 AEC family transporter [Marinomonas profundi]
MDTQSVILDVAAPVLLMIAMGALLRRVQLINDGFILVSSRFVFMVSMPALFFFGMLENDLSGLISVNLAVYFIAAIVLTFLLAWWLAVRLNLPESQRGVFVQVAFRGNCGIFSVALVVNMFGKEGVAIGGVMSGLSVFLFNVLAEVILTRYSHGKLQLVSVLKSLLKNPLILGIVLGVLGHAVGLTLPIFVMKTGALIGGLSLPLALICIGGALATSGFSLPKHFSMALVCKVALSPILFTALGYVLGFSQKELLFLFLFLAAPTAASAYVTAVAKGDDGRSTANSIAITTLFSSVIIVVGIPIIIAFTG